ALSYAPRPIVYEYESPEHATYGAVLSMALPDNTQAFLPPEHADVPEPTVVNLLNPGSPSAVRDGDSVTFAQSVDVGSLAAIFYAADPRIVGFHLKYYIESDRAGWPGAVFMGRVSDHGATTIGRVRS